MTTLIYTSTSKSKVSRRVREAREQLLKEQRAIKNSIKPLNMKKPEPYRRTTETIKSVGTGVGVAPASEQKQYTGNVIIGISQMHKSNAVPVINESEVVDIARMRR